MIFRMLDGVTVVVAADCPGLALRIRIFVLGAFATWMPSLVPGEDGLTFEEGFYC